MLVFLSGPKPTELPGSVWDRFPVLDSEGFSAVSFVVVPLSGGASCRRWDRKPEPVMTPDNGGEFKPAAWRGRWSKWAFNRGVRAQGSTCGSFGCKNPDYRPIEAARIGWDERLFIGLR